MGTTPSGFFITTKPLRSGCCTSRSAAIRAIIASALCTRLRQSKRSAKDRVAVISSGVASRRDGALLVIARHYGGHENESRTQGTPGCWANRSTATRPGSGDEPGISWCAETLPTSAGNFARILRLPRCHSLSGRLSLGCSHTGCNATGH